MAHSDREPRVPVSQVVAQVGGSREAFETWRKRVGAQVEQDWADRPVIAEDAAREIVARWREAMRRDAECAQAWERHLQQRQVLRQAAGDAAAAAETQRLLQLQADPASWRWATSPISGGFAEGGVSGDVSSVLFPAGRAQVRAALIEALERWDREHPLEDYAVFERKFKRERRWD